MPTADTHVASYGQQLLARCVHSVLCFSAWLFSVSLISQPWIPFDVSNSMAQLPPRSQSSACFQLEKELFTWQWAVAQNKMGWKDLASMRNSGSGQEKGGDR